MKRFLVILIVTFASVTTNAQLTDKQKVERACLDYLEGFYEGDTTKLIRSLKPSLYKFGYWRNDKTGKYEADGQMTFKEALTYANNVRAKKNFAKTDAPNPPDRMAIVDYRVLHGGISCYYHQTKMRKLWNKIITPFRRRHSR